MTECMGYCLQPRHEPKKPGSIGKPVPGMEIRIIDRKGRELPDGEIGEIWLKSDAMFEGYWQNPEATREAMVNGWFRTGDMGRRDADGFYHFVGRIKELIVRGGTNISPVVVEDVLEGHPAVDQCGVVGFPDEHWGEVVGAFIQLVPGADQPSNEDVRAFVAQRLADYMLPERIEIVDRLPRNAVGKLDRHVLHVMARRLVRGP
jgi:acyl-CoA synthetase (AMP-forming)/AMP-acid ligase II